LSRLDRLVCAESSCLDRVVCTAGKACYSYKFPNNKKRKNAEAKVSYTRRNLRTFGWARLLTLSLCIISSPHRPCHIVVVASCRAFLSAPSYGHSPMLMVSRGPFSMNSSKVGLGLSESTLARAWAPLKLFIRCHLSRLSSKPRWLLRHTTKQHFRPPLAN